MVWLNRVEAYLDDLEVVADGLSRQMKQMQVDQVPAPRTGMEMQPGVDGTLAVTVNEGTKRLAASLAELETRVAQREVLLRATDAPQSGLTLTAKLESSKDQRSKMLGQRCELIGEMMAEINNQAVSLFVCQFHLANLTEDVVRIMAGVSEPTTYGNGNKPETLGGNLFSESA